MTKHKQNLHHRQLRKAKQGEKIKELAQQSEPTNSETEKEGGKGAHKKKTKNK